MEVRPDVSLVTSLRELRAIEQQRVADERAAVEAALQAKRRDRETAERVAREAEAARLAAERDAALAADAARAAAEREERLRIEAAEATERARQQVALDQHRFVEEMALRREVARRQRPRWMMALTSVAVAAALAMGWYAVASYRDATAARAAFDRAFAAQTEALEAARRAQAALDELVRRLDHLDHQITAAIAQVDAAQGAADRRATREKLIRLQREEAELKAAQRRRQLERERLERLGGVKLSDDCLNNPVCRKAAGR